MKKTVLITGASRGIGKAIAIACAKEGYGLVLTCKNSIESLTEVSKTCTALGAECLTFVGDMGNENEVYKLMEEVKTKYDGVDVLVNNAGISHVGLLSEMTTSEWDSIISTNLSSVFHCSKSVIPYMVSKKAGKIFNISSVWGQVGASCEVAYSATKGGMDAFTKALAKELAPSNIQVNALSLGVIDTKMNQCFQKEELDQLVEEIPVGRLGQPEEVAEILLSMIEGKTYMTGQIIGIDGGFI